MGSENEVPDPIGFGSKVPAAEQINVKIVTATGVEVLTCGWAVRTAPGRLLSLATMRQEYISSPPTPTSPPSLR